MFVIIDFCLIPIGVGVSVSRYVVECQKIFKEANLNYTMHAYGTNVEGEWDEVFAAVKKCHEVIHGMGAPRISSTLRVGTRTDRKQNMSDKIVSVKEKLNI